MGPLSSAIFPGSFDPLTKGHIDIVHRALNIFEHVNIAVLSNLDKETFFSVEERVQLVKKEFEDLETRITVDSFSGLLVDYAKEQDIKIIIRGLRAISDYDYEAQMALINKSLCDDIETFFLMTREKYSYISSSLAKDIILHGGSASKLVSPGIEEAMLAKVRG